MPDAAPDDDGARPSRRRRRLVGAVGLLVAAGVVGAVVLVVGQDADADADVRDVAASFGEHLLTFDPDRPDAGVEGVLDRSAGEFADSYRQAVDAGLVDVLLEAGTRSRARAEEVLLGPVVRGRASAFVDLAVRRSSAGDPAVAFPVYLRLELVDGDRGWAVEDVTSLEESRRTADLTPAAGSGDPAEEPSDGGG